MDIIYPSFYKGELGDKLEFLTAKNLTDALELKAKFPAYHILAGGTDICVLINSNLLVPKGVISISGIDELTGIKEDGDSVELGPLTTHTEIVNNDLINKYIPALAEACMTIGARQIQNMGTIGGNIMNASPAGDALPVFLAYETTVEASCRDGVRRVPFGDFYKGYKETALEKNEIVTKFTIRKAASGERAAFIKIGARKSQAISKVMGCFRLKYSDQVEMAAIAFGSVAPIPVRLSKTEKFLMGKKLTEKTIDEAVKMASSEVTPIDDIRSTAGYRKYVTGVLLGKFLNRK